MRILIAEDDTTSRLVLEAVLTKQGHTVHGVADGRAALEKLTGPDAPRLAVLDWMMPEIDGVDVVQAIRAQPTDSPPYLIMLTTKSDKADIVKALETGADDYLIKPYNISELNARVAVGARMLNLQSALAQKITDLNEALADIKALRSILPICSRCKNIRDDSGYWSQVEEYMLKHGGQMFSHTLCPDCFKTLYPDMEPE